MESEEIKTSLLSAIVTCHFSHRVQARGVMVSTLGKARPDFKDLCVQCIGS